MAEYIERDSALRVAHTMRPEDKRLKITMANIPAADVAPMGWISVRDKLPEPEQDVLVIAHGWSNRLLYIGSYQRVEAETSWLTGVTSKASDWSLWGWSYLREPEVTHWMPLPDPPKDTETEESA